MANARCAQNAYGRHTIYIPHGTAGIGTSPDTPPGLCRSSYRLIQLSSVRCVCRHAIRINDPHSSQPLAGLAVHLHTLTNSIAPHKLRMPPSAPRPMLVPARVRPPITAAASAPSPPPCQVGAEQPLLRRNSGNSWRLGLFLLGIFILLDSVFEVDLSFRCIFPAPASTEIPAQASTESLLLFLLVLGLILVLRRANLIEGSLCLPYFPYEPQSKHTNANECDNGYRRQEDNQVPGSDCEQKSNVCACQMPSGHASGLPARTSCMLTLDLSELEDTRER